MSETILQLDDARLSLKSNAGEIDIIKGVSLSISKGERIGLIGPSGSGKSTLLMLMGGLERATGGKIRAIDQDLGAMNEDQLADFRRANMGIVFQAFHLIPTMTALENVATPLELEGDTHAFDTARERLGAVGLGHRLDHYPGQLSGGEQQRVALARAAVSSPRILLADEPTGNLDTKNGEAIIDLLFEMNKSSGATLVLVTHDADLAARCDRVIRIEDGRITEDAS